VATSVLHNVGNVLNSVNISATVMADHIRRSKASNVGKVAELLTRHTTDLGDYLTKDPKGKIIPAYLASLTEAIIAEQATITDELAGLQKNIDHIKDIVAMQQNYAKTSGVLETIPVPDLIEDSLRMNSGSLASHEVEIVRDYGVRPAVTLEKHKVLQILVNLIRNARYACEESGRADKVITLRTTGDERCVRIAVIDNGVGIPAENLVRIFNHGFTTRATGHGFGLHSGALAARELGGALLVHSDGPGLGATFTLELPLA
jgi:signal transduction histidine kinase